MNSDLPHLHELEKTPSRSAMGRVTGAWAVIGANLRGGKTLREVWETAERDGLNVPYPVFKIYVQRLRRRGARRGLPCVPHTPKQTIQEIRPPLPKSATDIDPLRNLREQRAKTKGFEFSPFPRKGLTQ